MNRADIDPPATTAERLHRVLSSRVQRWLLLGLFAVLALHYGFTYQPIPSAALHKLSAPELPPSLRRLNASEMETAFTRLQFDAQNQLLIDAQTASRLDTAAEQLPADAAPAVMERVSFLIGKQFPPAQAQQVEALFLQYLRYKQREVAWLEQQPPTQTRADERRRFEQLSALQDEVLGLELAAQLYGEHRRLARYMFAAEALNADASLSAEEKQNRLQLLQQLQQTIHSNDEAE